MKRHGRTVMTVLVGLAVCVAACGSNGAAAPATPTGPPTRSASTEPPPSTEPSPPSTERSTGRALGMISSLDVPAELKKLVTPINGWAGYYKDRYYFVAAGIGYDAEARETTRRNAVAIAIATSKTAPITYATIELDNAKGALMIESVSVPIVVLIDSRNKTLRLDLSTGQVS
jgi:hypothetical protein